MRDIRMYKGKPVELLAITHVWAGEQYCTILMENRYGTKQRQSVLLRRLTPVPANSPTSAAASDTVQPASG
jgi:hypothetical protein